MSAPVFDFKITFRPGFQADMDAGFAKVQYAFSQQVAKNVFLWPERSWVRKGLEAYFTVLIELFWSKRRIMEVYLNVAEWGDGIYGAEAASRHYFHKSAAKLSRTEAARLVSILPSPKKWSPTDPSKRVKRKARNVRKALATVMDDVGKCLRND